MFYTKALWHHFLDNIRSSFTSFPRISTDEDGVALAWIRKETVVVWQAFPAAIAEIVKMTEMAVEESVVPLVDIDSRVERFQMPKQRRSSRLNPEYQPPDAAVW